MYAYNKNFVNLDKINAGNQCYYSRQRINNACLIVHKAVLSPFAHNAEKSILVMLNVLEYTEITVMIYSALYTTLTKNLFMGLF